MHKATKPQSHNAAKDAEAWQIFRAIRTLARSEDRLRRGVFSMTHMYGPLVSSGDVLADGGANVGQLTSLTKQVQTINFMPHFSGVPANVRAVEG